jgi:hypothetical protein
LRHSLHRRALLAAILLAAAAAPASALPHQLDFSLSGSQENPEVATEATGHCVGVLSEDETTVTLSCTHTVTNPTAAHIHPGVAGVNGPILFDLGDPTSPIVVTWNPTPAEVAELFTEGFYVNVHSAAFPDGEIRGQMLMRHPIGETLIHVGLSSADEVPPVPTGASGRCLGALDASRTAFELVCVHDVVGATAAHIHLGAVGTNGDIIFDLGNPASPIRATWLLASSLDLAALEAGQLYVNVHSGAFPDGEIRGQIDGCFADADTLCLLGKRFAVNVTWSAPTGASGLGQAVGETEDSGMFWFLSPNNIEIQIKVLNACGVNDRVWVFFSGTTNLAFELTVTDTETGLEKSYRNPQGEVADPQLDTQAFPVCPL